MDLLALQAGLGIGGVVVGLLVLVLAIVTVYQMVEIVDAYEKKALTVFGEFRRLLEPGINFIPPFVSRTYAFDMRTQTLDVPRQEAITRDNSPVTADAVVYIKVMDAKKAFLEVDDYKRAVSNLAQTTLRAVLGDMELDDTLNKRQEINARIRKELDEPTDEWGVRVESVEVREVNPSADVQQAMEQQTSAERRRRAMILEAQGERRSAVEQAEGEKQSNIIRAQGEKQSQILEAQGDAISTVLRAKSAESMGERAIIDKGMETLERIGQGESTTFVLPQELTSLVGRYGKQLTGSDVQDMEGLSSKQFDEETRELIGLDDIEEILGQIDQAAEMNVEQLEQEAEAIKAGAEVNDIKSPDEVIAEADEDEQPIKSSDEVVAESEGAGDAAATDGSADANSAGNGQPAADEADDDESEISFEKDLE
ncbi:SPFH domain-containing protein [Haloferax volcanii]|uniref:Stomatin-prohibitin-like protein n=3 Tax=Haloferax volcanii TaxID=2246 RepID=A0A384LK72_HALVD|nr:SPFH domain-containing protein [Haloferax volcanii]ADE02693.1 stomatin family protein [Haloferax volcanii DS2]ELY26336.1 stomatin-prohibitin-like protein [Haloferax volcanii DS2]MBS8120220.1 SPFH/Band 7/PHB domain protein [Haloferax volcanii]MBS8125258.1 SPFH/Band 7/PHB domain protein [Haloferax volcanii]MBS8129126.1 SPFH/Band 7/PHB domain protein [Haloferax volcanii]